jgi:hypothetical protein
VVYHALAPGRYRREIREWSFAIHRDVEGEQESFTCLIPDIDDVEIRARQILHSGRAAWGGRVLTRQDFPDGWMLRCGNRFCNGVLDPRGLVLALVEKVVENGVHTEKCGGTRSSPEGRRVYGTCERSWQLSVTVVRKSGKEDPPQR